MHYYSCEHGPFAQRIRKSLHKLGRESLVKRVLYAALLCSLGSFSGAEPAGDLTGVVTDPSGAVVPGARVSLLNPVSGYERSHTTDGRGRFTFSNLPPNPYHISVMKEGFETAVEDVDVRTTVPITMNIALKLGTTTTSLTVEAGDLLEREPSAHTDVDRNLFDKLPLEAPSSGLSSLVTLSTPGVVADSNGLFHALGEHADNQFSIDGQPITDQQSKVFSNQLPVEAVQSLEVISGIPAAEYGDKNSLVIRVVTRSGLDQTGTHGSISGGYGTFKAPSGGLTLSTGNGTWGNFLSINGLRSDRFLDPPEFEVIHARGDEESVFDRIDWHGPTDTFRLNLGYTRSRFQIPNTYDQAAAGQDQQQRIETLNGAPSWTHIFGPTMLVTATGFVRHDEVDYYPSSNIFADLPATLSQTRTLTNAGVQVSFSYSSRVHNLKTGFQYAHWSLSEKFGFGITDPTFNAPCLAPDGTAAPGGGDPARCSSLGAGFTPNFMFQPGLLAYDLSRNGRLFAFDGSGGINEEALFIQDTMTLGNWTVDLGLRGDNYDGLSSDRLLEPRVAFSYNITGSKTVLRAGYGRFLETPFNENLVLSSSTGLGGLASGAFGQSPPQPGRRDQFNGGFQQAFGRYLVLDADYFWKYTKPAYDFDVLFSTPLTFPIQWNKSKIDGVSVRLTVPKTAGFSAYAVVAHTRSRYFGPETGGIIFNSPLIFDHVFRIDHDEALASTVHFQYQPKPNLPWVGATWRYDSGLVTGLGGGTLPPFDLALALTADQQAAMGLYCGSQVATPQQGITSCPPGVAHGATLVRLPSPGTENDDKNPPRVAPRHLFDVGAGIDNLLGGEGVKLGLRVGVINLTDRKALYNFLSTFSGTHFVSPRAVQGEIFVRF